MSVQGSVMQAWSGTRRNPLRYDRRGRRAWGRYGVRAEAVSKEPWRDITGGFSCSSRRHRVARQAGASVGRRGTSALSRGKAGVREQNNLRRITRGNPCRVRVLRRPPTLGWGWHR